MVFDQQAVFGTAGASKPFYVTFGTLSERSRGWVTIYADSLVIARAATIRIFGDHWASLYAAPDFSPFRYPDGELSAYDASFRIAKR